MPSQIKAIPLVSLSPDAWETVYGTKPPTTSPAALYSSVPWLYRAVEILSQAVSSLPKRLVRGDGAVEDPVSMIPYYGELADLFNQWTGDYLLYGSCYALITRRRNGSPYQLRRLSPTTISPVYDKSSGLVGFTRRLDGAEYRLNLEDVAYVFAPNREAEIGPGIAPVTAALKAAGSLLAIDSVTENLFAGGAIRPTLAVFKTNLTDPERERVQSLLRRAITGIKNAAKLVALSSDVTIETIGEYPDRLAMPELTEAKRQDICTAIGIPATLLFSNAANYATAHQDAVNFYDLTVLPLAQRMCSALNNHVFSALGVALETAENELELYQQFETVKVTALSDMLDRGVITVAEYRERMGFDPLTAGPEAGTPEPLDQLDSDEDLPEVEDEVASELRTWERFASKRLRAGKPIRPFTTRFIPSVISAAIESELQAAKTAADVKSTFDSAASWLGYP